MCWNDWSSLLSDLFCNHQNWNHTSLNIDENFLPSLSPLSKVIQCLMKLYWISILERQQCQQKYLQLQISIQESNTLGRCQISAGKNIFQNITFTSAGPCGTSNVWLTKIWKFLMSCPINDKLIIHLAFKTERKI